METCLKTVEEFCSTCAFDILLGPTFSPASSTSREGGSQHHPGTAVEDLIYVIGPINSILERLDDHGLQLQKMMNKDASIIDCFRESLVSLQNQLWVMEKTIKSLMKAQDRWLSLSAVFRSSGSSSSALFGAQGREGTSTCTLSSGLHGFELLPLIEVRSRLFRLDLFRGSWPQNEKRPQDSLSRVSSFGLERLKTPITAFYVLRTDPMYMSDSFVCVYYVCIEFPRVVPQVQMCLHSVLSKTGKTLWTLSLRCVGKAQCVCSFSNILSQLMTRIMPFLMHT